MKHATALVTDSSSQLPVELAERFRTEVGPVSIVPVTVSIGDSSYREGVDLTADQFYDALAMASVDNIDVRTAQPTPAAFLEAWEASVALGATEILAVLVGSELSGTMDAARLASQHVEVPVRLVDTGTTSFGVSCSVWKASSVLAAGGSMEEAAVAAEQMAADVQSVFVLGGVELARRSGRFDTAELEAAADEGQPVLRSAPGVIEVVGSAATGEEAVALMTATVVAGEEPIVVASGRAAEGSWPLTDAMEAALVAHPLLTDLVHYRVGPSVAAHTGPGTAGAFWFPARLLG